MTTQSRALELAAMLCAECEHPVKAVKYSTALKAAAELRRLAAIEAEYERIRALEPVAWGWFKAGSFFDAITPAEHADSEGAYKTPLYALPPKDPT